MLFLFLEAQSFLLKLSWVTSLIHLHKTKSWEFTLFAFLFYLSNFSYQYPFYWFFLWGSIHMWWSGVVGVAGTQRLIRANERPQQAAYSSNKKIFYRPNQHKTSTQAEQIQQTNRAKHTQWARAAKTASKQCNHIVPLNNQIRKICVSSALFYHRFLYNHTTN